MTTTSITYRKTHPTHWADDRARVVNAYFAVGQERFEAARVRSRSAYDARGWGKLEIYSIGPDGLARFMGYGAEIARTDPALAAIALRAWETAYANA